MEAIHYSAIAGIAVALFLGVKSSWDAKRLQEKQFRDNEKTLENGLFKRGNFDEMDSIHLATVE